MVFELHVWGPAFGLPSIDSECIATVAYFNRIVPQGQWVLIADYDTSLSPQDEFPVLLDGSTTTTGFASIVSYLRNHHSGAYDLDYNLTHQQQTDRTAFLSFLQSTASPLLDLYLYISSENYNATTSAAYTAILPWAFNYTLPPKRRDLARTRTTHLGLNSLDVADAVEDKRGPGSGTASSEYEAAKRAAGIPTDGQTKALSLGRGKGLGGLLGSPIYAARFRLDALSNELLEPLSDLLAKKDYLLEGDKPSSLDCLAFGYLALMLYPAVPQAWLKDTIQTKYPRILRYIRRLREDLLSGEEVSPLKVWSVASGGTGSPSRGLPWRARRTQGIVLQVVGTAREIISNLPLVSTILHRRAATPISTRNRSKARPSSLPGPLMVNTTVAFSAAVAAGLVGFAIHHRRNPREGALIFWALRPQTGFSAFGEAESFLSVLADQLPRGVAL